MVQKLDTYYGMELHVSRAINLQQYRHLETEMRTAVAKLGPDNMGFGVYVTPVEFRTTKQVLFDVNSLEARLRAVTLLLRVNKKVAEKKTMFFVNNKVPQRLWTIASNVSVVADERQIKADLSGEYCAQQGRFEVLVFSCVHETVPDRDRVIRVTAIASPTTAFRQKLHNTDGVVSTTLAHNLSQEVQLMLQFP